MNKNSDKTKEQLLTELTELRKESKDQAEKYQLQINELDIKVSQKTKELKKSMHDYQMLFNESPVPTWKEDFSQCKTYIDYLGKRNIKNFREYFEKNPDEVIELGKRVKIIDVNKAAVKLHEAQSKKEILHSLSSLFSDKSYKTVTEQLICIAEGKKEYASEGIVKTIAGLEKNILLKWVVVPGYEGTYEKVYVTTTDITERKRAEDKLKESEDRLSKTMMAANDGMWDWDLRTNRVFFDACYYQMAGYDVDESLHRLDEFQKRVHLEDIDYVMNEARNHLEGITERFMVEFRFKKKNDDWMWIQARGQIVERDEKNIPLRFIGSHWDVTERKQAEEALAESEMKFRNLSESTVMGIGLYQNDYWIYANPAAEEITGYSLDELKQMKFWEFVPPEYVDLIKERGGARQKGQIAPSGYEFKIITKQGKEKWIFLTGNTTELKSGKAGLISVLDITKRKHAEEALKKSEEKYRKIFENVQDIFYQVDTDGNIIEISPSIKRYSGYSREELIGTPVIRTYHNPEDRIFLKAELEKKGEVVDFEIRLKTKSERLIYVSLNAHILYDENKKPAGIEGSLRDITERKQVEESLRNSEETFKGIFNNTTDAIYVQDKDGVFLDVNQGAVNMYGYTKEELIGNSPEMVSAPGKNDMIKVIEQIQKANNGEPQQFEFWGMRKNGEIFPKIVRISAGNYFGKKILLAFATDITERKLAEAELIKLSTAVTQSSSVIAITDTDGYLEYVNPKFTEITGYSREEVIGKNLRILKSGEHSDEMYKELWETISSGKIWRGKFHNKKKNGELYWEMAHISPIFDEKGKIINYLKDSEDVTQQKRNEQIQNVIHNISNAVIASHNLEDFLFLVKDELGKLIDTTNFFVVLYDEKTDLISLPFHHDEKDRAKTFRAGKTFANYVIKTGKSLLLTKADMAKLKKSGEVESIGHPSEVWLGVPLKSKNKVTGIFAVQSYDNENAFEEVDVKMLEIISDQISLSLERLKAEEDLKIAKEKAEESDRLKSAFLANMSHEIRTPMNGILGFTQLLKETKLTGDEKDQFIRIIEQSGKRMLNTINDIVDISKIEAGQVEVVNSEVLVSNILEEQYDFFKMEAVSKGLELVYKPSSNNKLRIITDQHKLVGILTNLIKNAFKFTEDGSITFGYAIKTLGEKDVVEFYVKDTGIGIPANRVDAIFNRFEQADIEDIRAFQGSGLGLTISKSYVDMLGGKISVKSKEGEGSIFTFSIPFNNQNLKESRVIQNKEDGSAELLKNLSVIVAEDDEISRMFFETILENKVKHITFSTTGKETIEKFHENPDTDIILMDIKMPDMNGYDATREIRKFNGDVVIIAQTAFGLSGDKEKALEAGCNDHISKPIKREILFEKIQACLNKKGI